jgi:hypothetical protein
MLASLISGQRKWYLAGGGALLVAAAALGVTAHFVSAKDPAGLPPELSTKSLQANADNPQKLQEIMHDTMQRTDLSDEQRREAMHRMREVWQQRMEKRINEYFVAATADQKQAILDRQLDEMQEEMKAREAQREEMERQREEWRRQHERDGQQHRRSFADLPVQEQKTRFEARSPDAAARRRVYFQALRARATERGIQMPWGGFGGRGGPPGRFGPH